MCYVFFVFFKQKTAYEMRISDWSSDVCSSDLRLSMLNFLMVKATARIYTSKNLNAHQWKVLSVLYAHPPMPASDILKWVTLDKAAISRAVQQLQRLEQIGRASCRARVCQYV